MYQEMRKLTGEKNSRELVCVLESLGYQLEFGGYTKRQTFFSQHYSHFTGGELPEFPKKFVVECHEKTICSLLFGARRYLGTRCFKQ